MQNRTAKPRRIVVNRPGAAHDLVYNGEAAICELLIIHCRRRRLSNRRKSGSDGSRDALPHWSRARGSVHEPAFR